MNNYKRVKWACYTSNMATAIVANMPPLLLLTFRQMYGISYSLLGFLIFVNFFSQLSMDLMFSFFSHKFNIKRAVKLTPVLTIAGLLIYAVWPWIFPNFAFVGLVIGTIVFSISGGFAEVLISPVIAAIPAKNPKGEMSKLHSVYAWASVILTVVSTLFLFVVGSEYWQILVFITIPLPLVSAILYARSEIPKMETPKAASGAIGLLKNSGLIICIAALFLSGASELVMSQWSSSYLETAMGIPKLWGDIFGVAFFSFNLAIGRTLYAKYGKKLERVLLFGVIGTVVCYLFTALTTIPAVGLLACALCGLCVSMLWPGTLLVASDRFPAGGLFVYAIMAAAGDLGTSVGPQLVGLVTDAAIKIKPIADMAAKIGLSPEQLGMKLGMLVGMLFPLAAVFLYIKIWKKRKQ